MLDPFAIIERIESSRPDVIPGSGRCGAMIDSQTGWRILRLSCRLYGGTEIGRDWTFSGLDTVTPDMVEVRVVQSLKEFAEVPVP